MAYTRTLLSNSTSGKPVVVAATASVGTLIHTAVAGATSFDEIYLWAANIDTSDHTLTIEWGAAPDAGALIKTFKIPANSPLYPVATGQVLNGGLSVNAFADAASKINITGYVNRITP